MIDYHVETVKLERMKLAAMMYISKELADEFAIEPTVTITNAWHHCLDAIVIQVRQEVFGRQLTRFVIEHPSNWWQAFKERWFPAWALNRWPMKVTTHTIESKELYPDLAMPDRAVLWAMDKVT